MTDLELEIKTMIVTALHLEELRPEDINSDEPLFGDGLGLDSIDGLELGMALRKTYGLRIEAASDEVRRHFTTVRTIAAWVAAHQGQP